MKNFFILLMILFLSSCKGCNATMIERQASVREVCSGCILTKTRGSENTVSMWIAQDTSKQPNLIHQVIFCDGILQPVWKVDYLICLN